MRWAAAGGLRSLVEELATGLEVELEHPVERVGPGPEVDGLPADVVVLAMPDPQARGLVPAGSPAAAELVGRAWRPVIAVAAGWARRQWAALPAGFVNDHPVLTLAADDGDRRGDGAPVLVAHTTAAVAARYDADPAGAAGPAVAAVRELLDIPEPPVWTHAHRWRFASPAEPRERSFHLGADRIALAGDGWGSPRIETAWRSGTDLGRAVVAALQSD
jgi:predicted NAD/FAD-dependent oxidoreductase